MAKVMAKVNCIIDGVARKIGDEFEISDADVKGYGGDIAIIGVKEKAVEKPPMDKAIKSSPKKKKR